MNGTPTDETLIEELQQLSERLEHPPSKTELVRYSRFSISAYENTFDSLADARDAAELSDPTVPIPTSPVDQGSPKKSDPPSHNDLLKDLYLILGSVSRAPTDEEIQQFGIYEPDDFIAQFGSVRAAIERVKEGLSGEVYKLNDLIDYLKKLRERLERPPLATDILRTDTVPLRKYGAYFNSWEMILNHAGFSFRKYTNASREELSNVYYDLWDRLGRPPLPKEITKHTDYSRLTYIRRFGNWGGVINAANRTSNIPFSTRNNTTRLLLALDLRRIVSQTEGDHSIQAVSTHSHYNIETYQNEFEQWVTALEAAGLTPPNDIPKSNNIPVCEVREAFESILNNNNFVTFDTVINDGTIDPYAVFDKFSSWSQTTNIVGCPNHQRQTTNNHTFPINSSELLFEDKVRIDENISKNTILISDLDRVADEINGVPKPLDIELIGSFSPQKYLSEYGSWRNVVKQSVTNDRDWPVLQPTRRKDIFASLLTSLEKSVVRTGQYPTECKINTLTNRTSTSYIAAFGDIETALECAGVRTDEPAEYAKNVLAADLYRLAREFGERPPDDVLFELIPYKEETIINIFGSIRNGWTAAQNTGRKRVSKMYGIDGIEDYRDTLLSEAPDPNDIIGNLTSLHIAQMTPFSPETYISMFGSFSMAAEAIRNNCVEDQDTLNDDKNNINKSKESQKKTFSALWDAASRAGHPTQVDKNLYRETSEIPISNIYDTYDDFGTAAKMAGLEKKPRTDIPLSWYPPLGINLVNELDRVSDTVSGRPTADDMNNKGQTSAATYILRFGSWESACDAVLSSGNPNKIIPNDNNITVGIHSEKNYSQYSRAELLNTIKSLAEEIGRLPTTNDISENKKVSYTVIYGHFGSWENALREAELLPSDPSINLDTPVEDIKNDVEGLGSRGVMELKKAGYETVEDICVVSKSDLIDVPFIGSVTAENIADHL